MDNDNMVWFVSDKYHELLKVGISMDKVSGIEIVKEILLQMVKGH